MTRSSELQHHHQKLPETRSTSPPFALCKLTPLSLYWILPSGYSCRSSSFPTMDTLVAKYSRSPYEDEFYSEQQQREMTECLPPLSLKFDLPPIENVSRWKSIYLCISLRIPFCCSISGQLSTSNHMLTRPFSFLLFSSSPLLSSVP